MTLGRNFDRTRDKMVNCRRVEILRSSAEILGTELLAAMSE